MKIGLNKATKDHSFSAQAIVMEENNMEMQPMVKDPKTEVCGMVCKLSS